MSPLTKIFIVLLIILNIVFVSGTVVWVSRQQSFATAMNQSKAQLAAAKTQRDNLDHQLQLVNDQTSRMQAQLQAQLDNKQNEINGLVTTIAGKDTEIAKLSGNVDTLTAANTTMSSALQVAQNSAKTLSDQLGELRKSDTDLQRKYNESVLAINDLTNKYDVTNRQWRDALEQVAQLKSDNERKDEMMHKAGITEATPEVNPTPLTPLEAVVQAKQNIGGVPYGTISIGSEAKVSPGMQFKIVNGAHFLGYLTVDRVEPNQAIGRLSGPHVDEIRQGVTARTQL